VKVDISTGVAIKILFLNSKLWRRMVSFTLRSPYPWEKNSHSNGYEAGSAQQLVETWQWREIYCPYQESILGYAASRQSLY